MGTKWEGRGDPQNDTNGVEGRRRSEHHEHILRREEQPSVPASLEPGLPAGE